MLIQSGAFVNFKGNPMNKQKGFSLTGGMLALIIFGLIALISIPSYISAANYGNATEQKLLAIVENNENIYANGTQKVIEIAQVPSMYKNDLKEVVTAAVQGTYGPNGSQQVFLALKERNVNLDAQMYRKIQQVIEGFRNEFQNAQTQMLDVKRTYKTALGTVWQGMWLRFAGYPKTELSKFDIVTTETARETFRTKRDAGIQLVPAK